MRHPEACRQQLQCAEEMYHNHLRLSYCMRHVMDCLRGFPNPAACRELWIHGTAKPAKDIVKAQKAYVRNR